MAGEIPTRIQKQLTDEIAHTSRNNMRIAVPKMSVLGRDVLPVWLEAGGVQSNMRAHGLRSAAEHVPVAFAMTRVSVAVAATH